MTLILITRPQAASEKLAEALDDSGYDGVIEPMLTITPTAAPQPDTSAVQAVMATSGNLFVALQMGTCPDLLGKPCFCVGPRTADKAREFGFTNILSAANDGADLAKLIAATLSDTTKPILHIAARDIDSKAHDALKGSGFNVTVWPVYIATATTALRDHTVGLIKAGRLDAVLLFSPRSADTFKTLLTKHGLLNYCHSITVIGLSAAVTDVLKQMTWRKLVAAPVPTEEAVIACLTETLPVA